MAGLEHPSEVTASTETGGDTAPVQQAVADVAPIVPAAGDDENENENDDRDSAFADDDTASSTASLTSSIFNYRKIHGRTFHAETGNASYWATNDESHSEVLDILHHVSTLCLDGELYLAPITNPKRILDIGTGTGIWAIDMADKFEDCEVIGTDISPIQSSWVPPNLKFELEDCSQEWTFQHDSFDFVHIRFLVGCIVDWTAFFKEAFKALEPGGYLESYEMSPNVFLKHLNQVPNGGWASDPKMKEIGDYSQLSWDLDTEGLIIFLTHILDWTREEVIVYVAHCRREIRSLKYHIYYHHRVVYGRKPFV